MLFRIIPVSPIATNCYLLGDDKVCCLVDPGGDADVLIRAVQETGLTLCAILMTHGHWDHWGAVSSILEAFPGIPVYIHEKEVTDRGDTAARYAFPAMGDLHFVTEGDAIQVGTLTFRVLHTPGHSAGSVVYLWADKMLAGDTLFAGSCGRCDLPGGSMEEMMRSLCRLARLEGNWSVYPGHGPETTLVEERHFNPYMRQAIRFED